MKIIVVGETHFGSRTPQRIRALQDLGHEVTVVSTAPEGWTYETPPGLLTRIRHRLRLPTDRAGANAKLLAAAAAKGAEVIILDNAKAIYPWTLRRLRRLLPDHRLVWYSEDDMMNPSHRSYWIEKSVPFFNFWITTKTYNANSDEIPSFGAKRVIVVDNSFDPYDHCPVAVEADEREKWGAGISFVGTFEAPRARMIRHLADHDLPVRVWGNGWQKPVLDHPLIRVENRPVYGLDYQKVVACSAINLCFLRHGNRDVQTCRSVELPAMGGFMVHERSAEITKIFTSNKEAAYFDGPEELLSVCRKWLLDADGRHRVAQAGHLKAWQNGYSHKDRWRTILQAIWN